MWICLRPDPFQACRLALFMSLLAAALPGAVQVRFDQGDATVWDDTIAVSGTLTPAGAYSGILSINGRPCALEVDPEDGSFLVQCPLRDGTNQIWAELVGQSLDDPDTLRLTVGYNIRPEIEAWAVVEGAVVTLHSRVLENPDSSTLSYRWQVDAGNPGWLGFHSWNAPVTEVLFPPTPAPGEYYFDLEIRTSNADTVRARTLVTVNAAGIRPFRIASDHAAWIDSAVIYEVTPYNFVPNGHFTNITARIPELVDLGINTLWLQPVMATAYRGQGYDVTDYFAVRGDLGTPAELRELIATAKNQGLRVLFDIVLNHTSIQHPYARETVELGERSHYYHFYQRERDTAPYSRHYHTHDDGFIYYFWEDLPNLNYHHPEVRRWMTSACRYWIEEYGIDGYRFDAIWGMNARCPEFTRELRRSLKRLKPEVLLLAEDKATSELVFTERFDAAFDWNGDENWVSKWTWQTSYTDWWVDASKTIFNQAQNWRSSRLSAALTNAPDVYPPGARILRYLENNDLHRFIRHHGLDRTRMAAALVFTLPGIPLLYNGQEIGYNRHPYQTTGIFNTRQTIREQDSYGLFDYYHQLIRLRRDEPALISATFEELETEPRHYTYAFHRWEGPHHVLALMNMGDETTMLTCRLDADSLIRAVPAFNRYTDLFSGLVLPLEPDSGLAVSLELAPYSLRLILAEDSTWSPPEPPSPPLPAAFRLSQNYPNPFNSHTRITYDLPGAGEVRLLVYDLLGRRVLELDRGSQSAGTHFLDLEGQSLPSGVYFYRLAWSGRRETRKLVVMK